MLEAELAKAVRLLTLAVEVAAGGEAGRLELLRVLEALDQAASRSEPNSEFVLAILRATDPDRLAA